MRVLVGNLYVSSQSNQCWPLEMGFPELWLLATVHRLPLHNDKYEQTQLCHEDLSSSKPSLTHRDGNCDGVTNDLHNLGYFGKAWVSGELELQGVLQHFVRVEGAPGDTPSSLHWLQHNHQISKCFIRARSYWWIVIGRSWLINPRSQLDQGNSE